MPKIYLIAGENSGDFIGGNLIKSLKANGLDIKFIGIGGELMKDAGLTKSLFPIKEINLMGFIEIIPHIFKIKKLIQNTVKHILAESPDLLITIDSPGFTVRVAEKIRTALPHLKIIHIVAPSVWAYKPGRALKYAKIYDCLFAILPFEPPYFTAVGLDCRYIGHPILEQKFYKKDVSQNGTNQYPFISVTLGSRKGEILRHLPIFCEALNILFQKYLKLEAIFVLANPDHENLIQPFLEKHAIFNYSFSRDRLKTFANADIALAKSGTNTIEIAASHTPMVVAYKLNIISFIIIKMLIRVNYVSLINIIADREIFPELLQFDCNPSNISAKLEELLSDSKKSKTQVTNMQRILKKLVPDDPNKTPSNLLAEIILKEFV